MEDHERFTYMPPMAHQWDAYDDDQMAEAAYLMEMDHYEQDLPTHIARLFRPDADRLGQVERVVISTYPAARLIVFTYPRVQLVAGGEMVGCVREVPVGWRDMASVGALEECFMRHVNGLLDQGWKKATGWNRL